MYISAVGFYSLAMVSPLLIGYGCEG